MSMLSLLCFFLGDFWWPREMGTNVNGCWVWAFLKTEKDTKCVEPIGLGVGLFTGLLQAFSFVLWRWEAEE